MVALHPNAPIRQGVSNAANSEYTYLMLVERPKHAEGD
jgi:hypothetical protein